MFFNINPKAIVSNDKKYIKSESWKCPKSPGGAHFWIIEDKRMQCYYCPAVGRINGQGLVIGYNNTKLQSSGHKV